MNSRLGFAVYFTKALLRIRDISIFRILLIGFILRLIWSLASNPEPLADFLFYYEHAGAIASGLGYSHADGTPTAYWPVGYPAFLSLIFYLFGKAVFWGKIANVILSTLTIGVFYLILKRLTEDRWIRQLSAFILAVYPNQIFYTSLLSDSVLFQFLMLTGIYLLISGIDRENLPSIIAAGLFWACTVYTRPYAVFIPLLILWFKHDNISRTLSSGLIIYSIIIFSATPWIARNYQIFGGFVFISSNSGINLYLGNNPEANGTYKEVSSSTLSNFNNLNEYQADSAARNKALDYIMQRPHKFISLIPAKLFWMYADDTDGFRYNLQGIDPQLGNSTLHPTFTGLDLVFKKYTALQLTMMGIIQIFYWLILSAALFYLVFIIRNKSKAPYDYLSIIIVLYFTLISVIFFGTSRFHFPLIPFFIYLAANTFSKFSRPITPN